MLLMFTLDLPIDSHDVEFLLKVHEGAPSLKDGEVVDAIKDFCGKTDIPLRHPLLQNVVDKLNIHRIYAHEDPSQKSDE